MKIIFLNDDFYPEQVGGAATVVLRLSKELIQQGHQVVVVTTAYDIQNVKQIEYSKIKIYQLPVKKHSYFWRSYFSLCNPTILKKLNTIFVHEKPDVIHAHSISERALSFASLKLARKFTPKVFITLHDVMSFSYGKLIFQKNDLKNINYLDEKSFNYKVSCIDNLIRVGKAWNPFKKIFIRHYLEYTYKIFAVSHALKNALEQNKISSRIQVVHNGIAVSNWHIDPNKLNKFIKEHNLVHKKVIFFGGKLSGPKGSHQMLEILAKVSQKISNIKLLVVGGKHNFNLYFRQQAKKLKLDKHLIFTRWLDEDKIKLAYASCDLVIVPSICFDSLPTIILEALTLHKPVVATCLGGSKEIVEHKKSGLIINPFEIDKNSELVIKLLSNEHLLKQMGERGYQRVKNEFSIQQQVKELIKNYC